MKYKSTIIDKLKAIKATIDSLTEAGDMAQVNNYLALFNKLLVKHNLSTAEVETHKGKEDIKEGELFEFGKSKVEGTWEIGLASIIAQFNFCQAIIYKTGFTLIGSTENVVLVRYFYEVAAAAIRRAEPLCWKTYAFGKQRDFRQAMGFPETKEALITAGLMDTRNVFRKSFFKGAVYGLHAKLEDERKAMEENQSGDKLTELTKVNDTAIDDWLTEHMPDLGTKNMNKNISSAAGAEAGYETGNSLNLNRGVNEGGSINEIKRLN